MGPGRTWPPGLRGVVKAPLRGLRYAGAQGFRGILDQIGPAPVAAWSLSRALSASYAGGPLCDLRRSSDSGTLTVLAGDDGEADLGSYAAWAGADTIFCAKVYDQSGGGNHLVQATPASQPKFTPDAGPNGRPAIFDDDTRAATMTLAGGSSIDGMWATGGSAYLAARVGASLGGSVTHKGEIRLCQFDPSGATAGYTRPSFTHGWTGAGFSRAYWRVGDAAPWAAGDAHLWTVAYDAAATTNDPTFYIDGVDAVVQEVTPPAGVAALDTAGMVLFSFQSDGQQIVELLLFAAILSSQENGTLCSDMVAHYVP